MLLPNVELPVVATDEFYTLYFTKGLLLEAQLLAKLADQVQTDTYLACGILAETLSHMDEAYVRDYLVERVAIGLSHRIINGYYPWLGLASSQRFASKGGYIVRFAESTGTQVTAETDWVVP